MARLFVLKGDQDRAEKAYLKAMSLDPKPNVTYIELSRLYGTKGQMDKAEAELMKMLKASGSTSQNLNVLALFYESTGKWEQAEKAHMDAVSAGPKEDVAPLMSLGSYYARRKEYDKALEAMKQASAFKKDDLDIQVNIAQLHLDFNKIQEGEAAIDKVLEKDKGHVGANFLKGRILLAKRDFARCLERFDLVLKEQGRGVTWPTIFRALALIGKGEAKLAEPDLVKAHGVESQPAGARLILAETYLRERNKDLARQQIEPAMKLAPNDLRVHHPPRQPEAPASRIVKGAEEAFKKVVELNPDFAPGYVRLGVLYDLTNGRTTQRRAFKKALEVNPLQTEALALLTGIYVRDKKYDEALKVCEAQKQKIGRQPPCPSLCGVSAGKRPHGQG